MNNEEIPVDIIVTADTDEVREKLGELELHANAFGKAMSGALKSAVIDGKSFSDVLNKLALSLSDMALNSALAPLEKGVGSLFSNFFSQLSPLGASPSLPTNLIPFADGGIVSSPTVFPMSASGSTMGLMGEAGSEAILPLARGSDGSLGVASSGSAGPQMNITFNISTPDVEGFSRSEAQISAMLARTVNRGRRGL